MKLVEFTVSRFIPGPAEEVFDVWLDPKSPGGPWYDAKRALLDPVVDGLMYFASEHDNHVIAHYGRFIAVERARRVEHTWMSEYTQGLETTVSVTFASGSSIWVTLS